MIIIIINYSNNDDGSWHSPRASCVPGITPNTLGLSPHITFPQPCYPPESRRQSWASERPGPADCRTHGPHPCSALPRASDPPRSFPPSCPVHGWCSILSAVPWLSSGPPGPSMCGPPTPREGSLTPVSANVTLLEASDWFS